MNKEHPTAEVEAVVQFSIQERDDDMLIAERHWQFGWRCIARRPKLLTNEEWRPEAERIVEALSTKESDLRADNERLRAAAIDALAGWRYIRSQHGDLYGVGWERVQEGLEAALQGSAS